MRYFRFYGSTPFIGEDFEQFIEEDDGITEETLDDIAADYAIENVNDYIDISNDYGIYREDFDSEKAYEEAYDMVEEEYYSGIFGNWEEITKERYEEEMNTIRRYF